MSKKNKKQPTPETHPPGAFTRPNPPCDREAQAFVFYKSNAAPIPEAVERLTANLSVSAALDKKLEERLSRITRPFKKTSYVVRVDSESSCLALELNALNDKLDIANENKRLLISALAL